MAEHGIDLRLEFAPGILGVAVSLQPAASRREQYRPIEASSDLLLSQWQDAPNLKAFVQTLLSARTSGNLDPAGFLERMDSLDEAEGIWLDRIGLLLGLARPSVDARDEDDYFGFSGSGQPFDQARFLDPDQPSVLVAMGDTLYRRLLKARGWALLSLGERGSFLRAVREIEPLATIEEGLMSVRVITTRVTDLQIAHRHRALPLPAGVALDIIAENRLGLSLSQSPVLSAATPMLMIDSSVILPRSQAGLSASNPELRSVFDTDLVPPLAEGRLSGVAPDTRIVQHRNLTLPLAALVASGRIEELVTGATLSLPPASLSASAATPIYRADGALDIPSGHGELRASSARPAVALDVPIPPAGLSTRSIPQPSIGRDYRSMRMVNYNGLQTARTRWDLTGDRNIPPEVRRISLFYSETEFSGDTLPAGTVCFEDTSILSFAEVVPPLRLRITPDDSSIQPIEFSIVRAFSTTSAFHCFMPATGATASEVAAFSQRMFDATNKGASLDYWEETAIGIPALALPAAAPNARAPMRRALPTGTHAFRWGEDVQVTNRTVFWSHEVPWIESDFLPDDFSGGPDRHVWVSMQISRVDEQDDHGLDRAGQVTFRWLRPGPGVHPGEFPLSQATMRRLTVRLNFDDGAVPDVEFRLGAPVAMSLSNRTASFQPENASEIVASLNALDGRVGFVGNHSPAFCWMEYRLADPVIPVLFGRLPTFARNPLVLAGEHIDIPRSEGQIAHSTTAPALSVPDSYNPLARNPARPRNHSGVQRGWHWFYSTGDDENTVPAGWTGGEGWRLRWIVALFASNPEQNVFFGEPGDFWVQFRWVGAAPVYPALTLDAISRLRIRITPDDPAIEPLQLRITDRSALIYHTNGGVTDTVMPTGGTTHEQSFRLVHEPLPQANFTGDVADWITRVGASENSHIRSRWWLGPRPVQRFDWDTSASFTTPFAFLRWRNGLTGQDSEILRGPFSDGEYVWREISIHTAPFSIGGTSYPAGTTRIRWSLVSGDAITGDPLRPAAERALRLRLIPNAVSIAPFEFSPGEHVRQLLTSSHTLVERIYEPNTQLIGFATTIGAESDRGGSMEYWLDA